MVFPSFNLRTKISTSNIILAQFRHLNEDIEIFVEIKELSILKLSVGQPRTASSHNQRGSLCNLALLVDIVQHRYL